MVILAGETLGARSDHDIPISFTRVANKQTSSLNAIEEHHADCRAILRSHLAEGSHRKSVPPENVQSMDNTLWSFRALAYQLKQTAEAATAPSAEPAEKWQ